MALSIGFRIISFLPSCYSSYGVLDSYPGGTLTHCSCQPSLDAHFPLLILQPSWDTRPVSGWPTILDSSRSDVAIGIASRPLQEWMAIPKLAFAFQTIQRALTTP